MLFSSIAFLASSLLVSALPAADSDIAAMKRSIIKRQSQSLTSGINDLGILQFALTLEHIEATFYSQALAKFTAADFTAAGYPTNLYRVLQDVSNDESTHVVFLTSAVTAAGGTPVQACKYKFPYEGVKGFMALAQVLEGVGVGAYLGAAGDITLPAYLTAAGAILTIEARHNAFIRYINGEQPAPQPNDTPQSAKAVVTMASGFFDGCPAGSDPAIAPFPALTVSTAAPKIGSPISLTAPSSVKLPATVFCGFASGLGAAFSPYNNGTCMIPTANVTSGQTYVVLTSGPSVDDKSVLAGPAILDLPAK